ncbi:MAG: tail fiber domain-containing protein [Bacteroidota bacterium]|nr:tail fiber domain-containing protein [Bacteroidota bacterium]
MQRIIFVLLTIITCNLKSYAQSFSINTDGGIADTSSILDIRSSAKGVLIPRMTKTQRKTIFQPATGLMVFQNGPDSTGFYFYDGSTWYWMFSTENMLYGDSTSWKRSGNSGTNPSANFVGTTDNQPLSFRVNNVKAGLLDPVNHNTSLGTGSIMNYTGSNSVAVGDSTLFSGTSGSGNVALGHAALRFTTTGNDNAALGNNSLYKTTTGFGNTGAGSNSLYNNTTGHDNTASGFLSLYQTTSGFQNTAHGSNALFSNTTGSDNTAIGMSALFSNTTGFVNSAIGFGALFSNTTGSFNTALGEFSMHDNTTGQNNTASGNFSLQFNTLGSSNTANGAQALKLNTTGSTNTATGVNALFSNTTGNNNTAVGSFAGDLVTTDTSNTFIGFGANNTSGKGLSNSTAVGNGASITASNQVRVGNSGVTSIGGQVGWSTLSDGRYKKHIQQNVPGLSFIMKLKPVTYNLDAQALNLFYKTRLPVDDNTVMAKEKIIYSGFIAQEVEKAATETGYDFSGVDKPKNEKDLYGLRYADFVVPMVKAIQEQQQTISDLQKQVEALMKKVEKLEKK